MPSISAISPPRRSFKHLWVFVALIVTVFLSSLGILRIYEPEIESQTHANLYAIAQLKTNLIGDWFRERAGDAKNLQSDRRFVEDALALAQGRPQPEAQAHVQDTLARFMDAYGYSGACLYSSTLQPLTTRGDCRLDTHEMGQRIERLRVGQTEQSEMYQESVHSHLEWTIALGAPHTTGQRPQAIALLRVELNHFLFPMIQTWPGASPSAETMLVRQSGNDVLYLNRLRHRPPNEMGLRRPMTEPALTAAIALGAQKPGVANGLDYRGMPVFAAYSPVEGTHWRLIAKVDTHEVLQPFQQAVRWTTLAVALATLIAGYIFHLQQRKRERLRTILNLERQARRQIEKSQEAAQFSAVFDLSPLAGTIVSARTGQFLRINQNFERDFGWTVADTKAQSAAEMGLWADANERNTWFQALGRAGRLMDYQTQFLGRDGAVHRVSLSSVITVLDQQDCIISFISDITERQATELHLRQLSLAIEQSASSVAITDIAGLMEYVNDAFVRATGYSRAEAIGQNPRILKSGLTPAQTYVDMWAALTQGQIWRGELHNKAKDGHLTIESAQITPLRNAEGRVTHYVAVKEDITERKRMVAELEKHRHHLEDLVQERTAQLETATQDLRLSEERFAFALDATNDGMWDWNLLNDQVHCNPAYFRMLGYAPDALSPNYDSVFANLLPPDERASTTAQIKELLQANGGYDIEFRMCARDGTYKWILSRAKVVERNLVGTPTRAVGTHTDLTVRKNFEDEMRSAQAAAESANKAKSAFLANMSHEIRTPMNAVIGLTHVLRQSPLDAKQMDYVAKIDAAGQHLMALINDILDISKIEANQVTLESTDFHLDLLLDNVYSMVADHAKKKQLMLTLAPHQVPGWLRGDATRLRQSLLNLLNNAIKFTEEGSVTLRAVVEEESDADVVVRFEVQDTGIGIPLHQQEKLFHSFEQADASTSRKYGGTGLGLAITKRLAMLMGGDAGLHSKVGLGSTFWFRVRLKRGKGPMVYRESHGSNDRADDASTNLRQFAGKRILVADDVELNRELAVALLDGTGLLVDTAADGLEALQKATSTPYALILMDLQMPRLDGLDATRQILALPGHEGNRIIAMTANIFDEDRLACEQAGMVDFVSKPIDPPALFKTLARWLAADANNAESPKPAAQAGMTPGTPAKVASNAPQGNLPGLDYAQGMTIWRDKSDKYLKFLQKFSQDYGGADQTLAQALGNGDVVVASALAHKLKGAAANLALTEVAQAAAAIEQQLKLQTPGTPSVAPLTLALGRATQSITTLSGSKVKDTVQVAVQVELAEPLMQRLIAALHTDNPDNAEPVLEALAPVIPAHHLDPLHALLDNFDFRGAELAARDLCKALGISIET